MATQSSLNSDRDYLEIVGNSSRLVSATVLGGDPDGVTPASQAPGAYSGSVPITHNLGSVPLTRIFYDADKNGILYNTPRWNAGFFYLGAVASPIALVVNTTTTTKLIINSFAPVSNVPVFYRIYRFGSQGLNSDEAIDKIFHVGTSSATLVAAANSDTPVTTAQTLPHTRGEQIFWKLQFSLDQANWYDQGAILFGAPDTATGPPGGPYARYFYHTAYAAADATNFYIRYVHNYASPQTIYVRFVQDYIN